MNKIAILIGLCLLCVPALAQRIDIAPVPKDILYSHHNDDFTVCVRTPGGEWQDLYEYKVMVDLDRPQEASMVQFDFEGSVEMRVKVNNGTVNDVVIRPLHQEIEHRREGNLIWFTLDSPSKLSLEINDDRLHNLHIFAQPLQTEIPDPDDPDVIWFAAGYHQPEAEGEANGEDDPAYTIPSGKTVYLAPGAVVNATFICREAENVRFLGRGIVLEPNRGFELNRCKNIEIDGITVINPTHYTVYGGQVEGLKIRNLKSFSCIGWSDGIDLMSCSDVEIDDIFMRNSDDCIAIYGHRWDFYGDARNYRITNAVLWADVAHPINIGLHGDIHAKNTIENLRFDNIDILEHDEDDRNYQGCIAFSVSDQNLVRDVVFENIRIERIQEGQLLNLRVLFNEKYSHGPGRGIRDVTFRNIYYLDRYENPGIIEGYSEEYDIEGVTFENIVIDGKRAETLEDLHLRVGPYARKITVK